jgi:hypothetical protein
MTLSLIFFSPVKYLFFVILNAILMISEPDCKTWVNRTYKGYNKSTDLKKKQQKLIKKETNLR